MTDPQSLFEFLNWKPAPLREILSEGLLYEGSKAFLYGKYKSLKSMLIIRLGLAIADGEQWVGFQTAKDGSSVLYLQLEIAHQLLQTRIVKMLQGQRYTKRQFTVWTESFIKLDTQPGLDLLDHWLTQVKPQVLIIDPVYKVLSGNILDGQSVSKFLDNLDLMIAKHNVTIILVSHTRKGVYNDWGSDDMIGSVFLSAWPDTIMRIERSNFNDLELRCEVVRHAQDEIAPKQITFNPNDISFKPNITATIPPANTQGAVP